MLRKEFLYIFPHKGEIMTFRKELDAWKKEYNMHGPKAMDRFIMLKFLQRVCHTSDDFVFKGGNLLWFYIKTPRETVDIDFTTNIETDAGKILETLAEVCKMDDLGLKFKVLRHKVIEENGKVGMGLDIGYEVQGGAKNQFGVDIVLGVQTDLAQIKINEQLINAASMENIIVDKVMASHSFGSGNTRAKDFDDLFRISSHFSDLDCSKLVKIASIKRVPLEMKDEWISEWTENAWSRHLTQYRKTIFQMT